MLAYGQSLEKNIDGVWSKGKLTGVAKSWIKTKFALLAPDIGIIQQCEFGFDPCFHDTLGVFFVT